MRVLVLDLETKPNIAHTWGLWGVNVGLPQLIEPAAVICFAAQFIGEEKMHFHRGPGLVAAAHALLNKADAVVTYNGNRFDLPWLRTEFVKAGLTPPSPFTSIDLCAVVKQQFRFPSNKLEFVGATLLDQRKAPTGGHGLWVACMKNDRAAWAKMRAYNEMDVELTAALYERLKPWIKLPNPALYGDAEPGEVTCPGCGSNDMWKRGLAYTTLTSYVRYQCKNCGRWARGKNKVHGVNAR